MSAITYCHVEEDDLPQIVPLWNNAAALDRCALPVLREKIFADPGVSNDLRLAAAAEGHLVGFVVGAVRQSANQNPQRPLPMGYVKLIAVTPKYQRQGVGSELLSRLELRLSARGTTRCRFAESAPNYLTPGLDAKNEGALAFLKAQGYARIGLAYNQTVDLRGQKFERVEGRWGANGGRWGSTGLTIRRATRADRPGLCQLLATGWPSWQPEVDRALANDPHTVFVALDDASVVAFAAFDANNVGTGWFGPMGTAPEAQGRGIGRVLLGNCLADIKDQGHPQATIPWVGPLKFYERHAGAKLSRTFVRLEKSMGNS